MTRTRPTTVREWLAEGGTSEEWARLLREERGLDRIAPPPWKPIQPLNEHRQPGFPIQSLPPQLREFAEAASLENQTPIDLAATASLAAYSAALSKKVRIEWRPGRTLPVNLFIANITQGTRSEDYVLSEARRPLHISESKTLEVCRDPIARRQCLRRQEKLRLRRLERMGIDSTRSRDEAVELAAQIEMNPVPAIPRLIVDDTTPGKLEKHLAEQSGRLVAFYNEAAILDLFTGTNSVRRLAKRAIFRTSHAGDNFYVEQTGKLPIHIEEPAISCHVTVPQASIEGLQKHRSRRGRGVLDCFLFSMPKKTPIRPKAGEPMSEELRDRYTQFVYSHENAKHTITLKLSKEARDVFQLWESEIETLIARYPDEAIFRAWLDQLGGHTLRIAAVLHMTTITNDDVNETISAETFKSAVDIARYFVPHTEAAFAAMHCHENEATDGARYLVDWIMADTVKNFTRREAHQRSRARFKRASEIDAPLDELVRRGYIRLMAEDPLAPKTAGRNASPQYEVNTHIFYMLGHSEYKFGEFGEPVTLGGSQSGAMPSSPSACESPQRPTTHSEHNRQQAQSRHAHADEGMAPREIDSEDKRQQPTDGGIEKPFRNNSEHKPREKRICDAPSVKEFKKKNAHLLKRYREKIVPLMKELEAKQAEEENRG